jgi:hypothetical protein
MSKKRDFSEYSFEEKNIAGTLLTLSTPRVSCLVCRNTDTPQWRFGAIHLKMPDTIQSLFIFCNACGLKVNRGRLCDHCNEFATPSTGIKCNTCGQYSHWKCLSEYCPYTLAECEKNYQCSRCENMNDEEAFDVKHIAKEYAMKSLYKDEEDRRKKRLYEPQCKQIDTPYLFKNILELGSFECKETITTK